MSWLSDHVAAFQQILGHLVDRQPPLAGPVTLAAPVAGRASIADLPSAEDIAPFAGSAHPDEIGSHFTGPQGRSERSPEPVAHAELLEKRRSVREKVIMPVRCRTKDGQTGRVILSELSAHGCRLYADEMMLRKGQWITIQPDKMEGMAGLVRWVDAKRAGVEFERPLYDAVAVHLQHLYAVPSDLKGTNIRVVSSSINPMSQRAPRTDR